MIRTIHRHSSTHAVSHLHNFRLTQSKKGGTEVVIFLKSLPGLFFSCGIESAKVEIGARILLGDNMGRAVMLRPIRFQRVGVSISTGHPCTYLSR
jgi:hypothetical protein